MKPILELRHPFPGVGLLKIHQPTVHDNTMISFLVMIDSRIMAFNLFHNGEWNENHKEGISKELIVFIREKIEEIYSH